MLADKPVIDFELAKELCQLCSVNFNDDSFTYFASDVNDDATKINYIIGICTFRMKGEHNIIDFLTEVPGIDDEEAMIIMARTVMNFMYRCEVKTVYINEANVSYDMINKLGFKKSDSGYSIDLTDFYKSPCSYTGK